MLVNEVFESPEEDGIKVWHGSKRWEGSPEVRGHKKGRYEAGPGIYTTTSYATAKKYAKGGGALMLLTLDPNLRLANTVNIPLAEMLNFLKNTRMKAKKEIAADLTRHAERMNKNEISANILINLIVNWDAGAGEAGRALAYFLVTHGVDAEIDRKSGEDWIVVINPKIIKSYKKVSSSEISPDMYDFPRMK